MFSLQYPNFVYIYELFGWIQNAFATAINSLHSTTSSMNDELMSQVCKDVSGNAKRCNELIDDSGLRSSLF